MEKVNSKDLKPTNEEILDIIKNKDMVSAKMILTNLKREITLPGLIKKLKQMIRKNEISYLDWNKKLSNGFRIPKKAIKEKLDLFRIRFDGRTKKYYYYLPLTEKLGKKLNDLIKDYEDKDKYRKMIWEITRKYGGMELFAISREKELERPELIKKGIKESYLRENSKKEIKGLRITKKDIETTIDELKLIRKAGKTAIMEINPQNIKITKIEDKEYFFVNDELIPKEKLIKFLQFLEFPPIINFFLSDIVMPIDEEIKQELGITEITNSANEIVYMMQNLFIEMVKDSQIKV